MRFTVRRQAALSVPSLPVGLCAKLIELSEPPVSIIEYNINNRV